MTQALVEYAAAAMAVATAVSTEVALELVMDLRCAMTCAHEWPQAAGIAMPEAAMRQCQKSSGAGRAAPSVACVSVRTDVSIDASLAMAPSAALRASMTWRPGYKYEYLWPFERAVRARRCPPKSRAHAEDAFP